MRKVCMHGAPLIETRQPAQSLEVLQVHQRGMGILSDGRCPPERLRPTTTRGVDRLERTNGHAACGHDGEPEPAVVDLDDIDAFLPAAVQRALLNGPRLIGPQAAAGCVNTPVVHVEVLGDRGEDLAHASLLAVAPRACRRPGSVGSSSRRAGAERSAQHRDERQTSQNLLQKHSKLVTHLIPKMHFTQATSRVRIITGPCSECCNRLQAFRRTLRCPKGQEILRCTKGQEW